MGIADEPICMFVWFVTNGPLVKLAATALLGDVTKFTAAPVVASPGNVTSTLELSTCNRFRNVTNSVLRLFKRCCKCTASFVDEASAKKKKKKENGTNEMSEKNIHNKVEHDKQHDILNFLHVIVQCVHDSKRARFGFSWSFPTRNVIS